jgi:hypothetical protein
MFIKKRYKKGDPGRKYKKNGRNNGRKQQKEQLLKNFSQV